VLGPPFFVTFVTFFKASGIRSFSLLPDAPPTRRTVQDPLCAIAPKKFTANRVARSFLSLWCAKNERTVHRHCPLLVLDQPAIAQANVRQGDRSQCSQPTGLVIIIVDQLCKRDRQGERYASCRYQASSKVNDMLLTFLSPFSLLCSVAGAGLMVLRTESHTRCCCRRCRHCPTMTRARLLHPR
jgi:hypothetical protein